MNEEQPQGNRNPNVNNWARIKGEINKDLKRVVATKFDSKAIKDRVEAWIIDMENYFKIWNLSNETKVVFATYKLFGEATTWWYNEMVEQKLQHGETTWE